ncbi:hypothetical protein Tco_0301097 [Tanacetum coccineum]
MFFSSATRDERLKIVEVKDSGFDGISFRSPVGKQLAKSCEAKSLDSSGFKEFTRSSISLLIFGYEGLAFIEATLALALTFACFSSSF